jgi:hypothetical protein
VLLALDLEEALFEAITRKLEAKAITVKAGTLVYNDNRFGEPWR